MRVLLVTDWAPTEGGIETYVVRLREELVRAGDDVRLLTSSAGAAGRGEADYVAFASDSPLLLAGLQLANPFAAATLRRAVSEFRPELVFVNMFERYLSPAVLRPRGRIPVVAMVHYYKPVCPTALKLLPGGEACAEPAGTTCLRHRCVGPVAWLRDQPLFVTKDRDGERAFDARSGRAIIAPDQRAIRDLARSYYAGNDPIASARLITDIPGEIRGRTPPLWRVEFDHWDKPTLYLSPVTGELLSRRHELWRIFDFVWMLHIMDYDERENVNNPLLRIFTWGAVLMALSGIWLLLHSFHRKKKKKAVRG